VLYLPNIIATGYSSFDGGYYGQDTSNAAVFPQGLSVGTTKAVTFANGFTLSGDTASASVIQGGNGQNLDIIAGNTAGDDIAFYEGTGDGGNKRLNILGGSFIELLDTTANLSYRGSINAAYMYDMLTFSSTGAITVEEIHISGITAPNADPSSGNAILWCDTDDDTCKLTDQASTDAAVTHAAIDLVP
jgi:hypothetical protein